MIVGASRVAELAQSQVPQDAWVLHFCPAFFDVGQLGRMETQVQGSTFSLDQLDSTTRCLLHEFTQ